MSNAIDALGSLWGPLLVLGQIGLFTLVLLISIAFLLLLDRKIWAGVMMRKGPNVVGPFGLLQSFADFGKFLLKEIVIPAGANKFVFIFAPILTCTLAFAAWAAIPVAPGLESDTSWVISDL
ncbi:NADH-quinone oxidoreductase subunit H, partial [Hyphomonas sp.]|uniref:NADH-quinone oxidoreductase subunit H n=1 Tax=Hyphomonas sp. TaxID=87 RepID=UPI0033424031